MCVRVSCAPSGAEIIHDRLVFAAQSFKPLKELRDKWAHASSTWLQQYKALKTAYKREVEATRAAEARAAAMGSGGTSGDGEPAPKRMRVRSAQVSKQSIPGTLTVQPGDLCLFIEPASNPLWSRVKMLDDNRVGFVSQSKVCARAHTCTCTCTCTQHTLSHLGVVGVCCAISLSRLCTARGGPRRGGPDAQPE